MKTSSEVLRDADIKYQTLIKYISLGLLPKPRRVWRGRKGSQSLYPDEVIDIINQIKLLKKQGFSLSEMTKHLPRQQSGIRVLKPTKEYLLPMEKNPTKSYVKEYKDLHSWLEDQIDELEPGFEVHSILMESVTRRGKRFLRPKRIELKPKAPEGGENG